MTLLTIDHSELNLLILKRGKDVDIYDYIFDYNGIFINSPFGLNGDCFYPFPLISY